MTDELNNLDNELDNMFSEVEKLPKENKKVEKTTKNKTETKKEVTKTSKPTYQKRTTNSNYKKNSRQIEYREKFISKFPETKFYLPSLREGYTRYMPI